MTQCEKFNRLIFEMACLRAQEPDDVMTETRALTDFDIMMELAKLTKKQLVQSDSDQDLCLICGEQSCVVKDYQEWIQCESCSKWVHQYCDGILNAGLTEQLQYECPVCRIECLRKHPCNVNEQLGRDPRFQESERTSKKQRRKRTNALSDSETNETAPGVSRGTRATMVSQPVEPAVAPVAPLSTDELASLRPLGRLSRGTETRVEEKAPMERRRAPATESSAQNILNYVNATFNQLRLHTAHTFHSLQNQAKQETFQVQPTIDYHHTDVCFGHFLALFQQNNLEINEQQVFNANGYLENQILNQGNGVKRSVQELETEKRHQEMIQSEILNYELDPFKPRHFGSIFNPILRIDVDLRVFVGLNAFDGLLQAVERNRLEYIKTLLPAAAQACWIHQQQSAVQNGGLSPFQGFSMQNQDGQTDNEPGQPRDGLIDMEMRPLDLTDPVVRRRMSIQNFVRITQKVLEATEPALSQMRLGHDGYLPASVLLTTDAEILNKPYKHSIFLNNQNLQAHNQVPQIPAIPTSAPFGFTALSDSGASQSAGQGISNSQVQASSGIAGSEPNLQVNLPLNTSGGVLNGETERKSVKTVSNKPPRLLNTRQWFDLRSRGVSEYTGLGLVRMTMLQAMVNIGLGMNVFDRVFGDPLTEHIIRFGVSSSRQSLERQLKAQGNLSAIEPGCLFEAIRPNISVTSEGRNLATPDPASSLVLPDDHNIPDWDILETPTSVVWGLQLVGDIVMLYNAEINGQNIHNGDNSLLKASDDGNQH